MPTYVCVCWGGVVCSGVHPLLSCALPFSLPSSVLHEHIHTLFTLPHPLPRTRRNLQEGDFDMLPSDDEEQGMRARKAKPMKNKAAAAAVAAANLDDPPGAEFRICPSSDVRRPSRAIDRRSMGMPTL